MPYVTQPEREMLTCTPPETVGQLTYALTLLIDEYVNEHGKNFAVLSDAVAALECSKLELYRRVIAEYEDVKCVANGDVYTW